MELHKFYLETECMYKGITLDGGDLSSEWASSFEHCRSICTVDPLCEKWTYNLPDNSKWCHLKQEFAPFRISRCENCVSGSRNSSTQTCNKKCKYYSLLPRHVQNTNFSLFHVKCLPIFGIFLHFVHFS